MNMSTVGSIIGPEAFIVTVLLASLRLSFVRTWFFSGAAVFTYILLVGERQQQRIIPGVPVALLVAGLNISCAAASTSWLFYWLFLIVCWPCMAVASIYQFDGVGDWVRTRLRKLLQQLQFTADKIALFDIPALEIDVDVAGLMVIRGMTISLSSLTIIAHGIEVGIKLSDDMELALQTEKVTVALFRYVKVEDVFGNIKGGQYEMTFGKLASDSQDSQGNALMSSDTALLRAANSWSSQDANSWKEPEKVKMTDKMTGGKAPRPISALKARKSLENTIQADDDDASLRYKKSLDHIQETSEINKAHRTVNRLVLENWSTGSTNIDLHNERHLRAAICSQLHDRPSIQHPPQTSIKVSTLKNLSSPATRRFLHRLPMLLRLLLNPIAYFHPVSISSITVAASGRWLQSLLGTQIFGSYGQGSDIRKLRERIFDWLRDANFAFQMSNVVATAQVPFLPDHDIGARIVLDDIIAYRTLPKEINLREVVTLGGADASIFLPSYLLPHHEHLLPSREQQEEQRKELKRVIKEADSMPKVIQAKNDLEHNERDETFMKISAHARLPVVLDQELLNFVAALVKATKIIEFEKENDTAPVESDVHGFKEFGKVLNNNIKSGLKQAAVNAAANDRWIAKLVGKITTKMKNMQGDIGYSGNVPIALKYYRDLAEPEKKILP